ncbi:uncharacterized protein LOC135260257 [Anguilla rostrata]|uniref:uncharacterized protein LOC135260257 n=1 Tax=Anguilla rostrata TaxID=7938 RepID=UPI0030D4835F
MIPCLLLLVCAITLDAVQQFPALMEVEAGRTARLKCSTNGMPATYCYTIIWTRVDSKTNKLISLKNAPNFVSTVASEQTECSFDIKNATADDSGTYYCLVVYGKMVYIGNGSNVIVTQGRKTAPPPIEILGPSGDVHGSFTRLLCMIAGVVPKARMFWVIDGRERSGFTDTVWTKYGDEVVESTQSQVLVPAEQWERGAVCTCVVEFDGRNTSKSVQKGACSVITDHWEGCYATVAAYRVVVTTLCLLSWTMTITAGICFRRKRNHEEKRSRRITEK